MHNHKYFIRDNSRKMTKSLALDIIKRSHITERSSSAAQNGYVTLIVGSEYNKCDIKKACEILYEEEVSSINILNKKQKKRGVSKGKIFIRSDVKKAMVKFKNDEIIKQMYGGQQ